MSDGRLVCIGQITELGLFGDSKGVPPLHLEFLCKLTGLPLDRLVACYRGWDWGRRWDFHVRRRARDHAYCA